MSNVTVQEALKAAIFAIESNSNGFGLSETQCKLTLDQCKAALSEIDKCEPVKYEWFDEDSDEWIETTKEYYSFYERDEREVRFLFTSPQPRDWVGLDLSEYEVQGLGAIAEEICEKLKQLNTKG